MAPPPAPQADRYDPMPGVFRLPGHLYGRLSPGGRRIAKLVGTLLLVGLAVTVAVLVPRITETKREQAAEERRTQAQGEARRRARLIAEQRPRAGQLPVQGAAALTDGVEQAITKDANERQRAGEIRTPVLRSRCESLGESAGRLALACTAITSEVAASEASDAFIVGYLYRAALELESGRYALCKTSGRPAEGLLRKAPVTLPRACGR